MQKTPSEFECEIGSLGYCVFAGIVDPALLKRLREDIPVHQRRCREAQLRNGLTQGMEGAAHHVIGQGDSLDAFLFSLPLHDYIEAYFGAPYILNSFGAINNGKPSEDSYRHGLNFHRDVRTYSPNFRLMLNMLVMVDDFTADNGATRVLPGSQRLPDRPSEAYLAAHAVRVTGSAGSIVLFDSNLWHSAAPNQSGAPRMALTLTFTRPFFKQQMDYARMLGEAFPPNEAVRQLLGYNARVPCGYDEWYQPPERRMYRPGQG